MLNDDDMESVPKLSQDKVSKLAFDEGLAILYHAVSTFRTGALTWEQSMQAAAILACRALRETQMELQKCRESRPSPLKIVR